MRIGIVARVLPRHGIGGMQDHTADLARGLAAAGHEVEVLAGRHPEGRELEESGGVRWHYVDAPWDDFVHRDWRERSHAAFVRLNAERPFDVVHGEGSSALELVRRGEHRRTPLVNEFHGNYLGLVEASLRRQLRSRRPVVVAREQRHLVALTRRHLAKRNWWVFRSCEAIVPSRQQLAGTCRSHLLDPRRVHVVANGVDTSVFRPRDRGELRARLGLPGGLVFACAGRLDPEKGMHHALHALAATREELPDAHLLVVGGGSAREPLERLAADLRIDDRVVFTGPQPRERMPELLAAADVFLFPTERDEALPLVLPQAMACGLPTISSRIGGNTEVVDRPGENGLLVAPGDAAGLAEAVVAVYRDPELRRRLGAGAVERVRSAYSLEQMIAGSVEVYRLARRRLTGED